MLENETYAEFFIRIINTANPSKIILGEYYINELLKIKDSHNHYFWTSYKQEKELTLFGVKLEKSNSMYHIDIEP